MTAHTDDLASAKRKLTQSVNDSMSLSMTTYECRAVLQELAMVDEVRTLVRAFHTPKAETTYVPMPGISPPFRRADDQMRRDLDLPRGGDDPGDETDYTAWPIRKP